MLGNMKVKFLIQIIEVQELFFGGLTENMVLKVSK
jgi:hypothetical protein